MIKSLLDLEFYTASYSFAMEIFNLTRNFPKEERYSLTDQLLMSSRSIPANIAEGFGRKIYENEFKTIWFMQWVHWKKPKFVCYSQKIVNIYLQRNTNPFAKNMMNLVQNFINFIKTGKLSKTAKSYFKPLTSVFK